MKMKCACWNEAIEPPFSPKISHWMRFGCYFRKSDSKFIRRWKCSGCGRTVSEATGSETFGQKRRRLNEPIFKFLCSGMSQRRVALILGTNLKTVARKLIFLGKQKRKEQELFLERFKQNPLLEVQFDEMETHEHTKWKPLSIALIVSRKREILGFEVSQMPARGGEAFLSVRKYGKRADHRTLGIDRLFHKIKGCIHSEARIKSDEKTLYPGLIEKHFPLATHSRFKGKRGCVAGQGELKKTGCDPLFQFNHTAAMLRANINRLIRRTWCSTKKSSALVDHLCLYVNFHNEVLLSG